MPSSVQKIQGALSRKTTIHGESGSTDNRKTAIWATGTYPFHDGSIHCLPISVNGIEFFVQLRSVRQGDVKKMKGVEPRSELHPLWYLSGLLTYNQVTRSAGRM